MIETATRLLKVILSPEEVHAATISALSPKYPKYPTLECHWRPLERSVTLGETESLSGP